MNRRVYRALVVLSRLAARRPGQVGRLREGVSRYYLDQWPRLLKLATETEGPVAELLIERALSDASIARLEALRERLNEPDLRQSVPLFELALIVHRRLLDLYDEKPTAERSTDAKAELANLHRNFAVRLGDLGRHEEAIREIHRAEALYRPLAEIDSTTHGVELASTLNNLGNRLAAVGRLAEALDANVEAAERFEAIEREQPGRYLALFALSLHNLASRLRDLGERDRALVVMGWAVERREELFRQEPERFRASLATSLDGLGSLRMDLGRYEEARETLRRALDLWQELANDRPDAYRPDLARTLHTLAPLVGLLGDADGALDYSTEAAGHYRRLVESRPGAFEPLLARALVHQGQTLAALGDAASAAGRLREAVAMFEALATKAPARFERPAASARTVLAGALVDGRRFGEALEHANLAARAQRRLLAAGDDEVRPGLAQTLQVRGAVLSRLGRPEDARAALTEAVELHRQLAAERPAVFESELSRSLSLLEDLDSPHAPPRVPTRSQGE